MPESLNPDQVRDKYVAIMGKEFGEAFCDLFNHVASLDAKWNDYVAMFGDKDAVDTLNKTAPSLFHDLQIILHESILLHICRVTERSQTAGQDNLTVRRIESYLPSNVDISFAVSLANAISDAIAQSEFARTWRNKKLAHTNLSVAAGGVAVIFPPAGKAEIESAIQSICEVINKVEKHYLNAQIGWGMLDDPPLGVTQMLCYLKLGRDTQTANDKKQRGG